MDSRFMLGRSRCVANTAAKLVGRLVQTGESSVWAGPLARHEGRWIRCGLEPESGRLVLVPCITCGDPAFQRQWLRHYDVVLAKHEYTQTFKHASDHPIVAVFHLGQV